MNIDDDTFAMMLNETMKSCIECVKCKYNFTLEEGLNSAIELGLHKKSVVCPKCKNILFIDIIPIRNPNNSHISPLKKLTEEGIYPGLIEGLVIGAVSVFIWIMLFPAEVEFFGRLTIAIISSYLGLLLGAFVGILSGKLMDQLRLFFFGGKPLIPIAIDYKNTKFFGFNVLTAISGFIVIIIAQIALNSQIDSSSLLSLACNLSIPIILATFFEILYRSRSDRFIG